VGIRDRNELKRGIAFASAFIDLPSGSDLKEARKKYCSQVATSIQEEIEHYKKAQDKVLKLMKINENIWNQSMDAYLSEGKDYLYNALKYSQSSPFTFH
jgi:formiminotetrahydrofolate cyclodeaminase